MGASRQWTRCAVACLAVVALAGCLHDSAGRLDALDGGGVLVGNQGAWLWEQRQHGVLPDLGTIWIGAWTEGTGWGGPEASLSSMVAFGVTPMVQFYYWGDDATPDCLRAGCHSAVHGVWKDRAGWQQSAARLLETLDTQVGTRPAVVVLESEFNKPAMRGHARWDAELAAMAERLQARHATTVVLGFGSWHPEGWDGYPLAVAASDAVGLQALGASTRHDAADVVAMAQELPAQVTRLAHATGKPVLVHDVGVSSHGDGWPEAQRDAVEALRDALAELDAAGARAVVWRSWRDDVRVPEGEHFGAAEKHWGLAGQDGALKPAAHAWHALVEQARAGRA